MNALGESLVGGVSWIKAPGAVGVDGQARDISAEEAVGDGVSGICICGGEQTCDGGCIFYCGLSILEGGNWSVVGTCESDEEGVVIAESIGVLDGVVNGDGLNFTISESVVGGISGVKGPSSIGIDGEALNDDGFGSGWVSDGVAIAIGDGSGEE